MKALNESEQETKDILNGLAEEAKSITVKTLPDFINKLITEYMHDHETITHVIALAAIAGANAVEHSTQSGITSFQGECIQWQFLIYWNPYKFKDKPVSMLCWENLLRPQYDCHFNTITKETLEWLQKEAKEKLKDATKVHSDVKKRWVELSEGIIPAGLILRQKKGE